MLKKITWSARAVHQFNDAIQYIKKDSEQSAEKVKQQILARVQRLSQGNILHRIDPCKKDNNGTFRYFVVLNYRISYCDKGTEIIIVRIRHKSMEPKNY